MAVTAFKSSSRRQTTSSSSTKSTSGRQIRDTSPPPKKAPIRRSRSVSVLSRDSVDASGSSTAFSNSRDNPLFATSSSPEEDGVDDISSLLSASESKSVSSVAESRRGRSVARNDDSRFPVSGSIKEVGRSFSKVDTGRRDRSLSRGPIARYRHSSCESEAEHELSFSRTSKNRSKPDLVSDQTKGLRTWSSQHSVLDPTDICGTSTSCSSTLNWDDKVPTTSSLSGSEGRTSSAICEKMKPVPENCLDADSASSVIYETIQSEVRRVISNLQHDYETDIRRSNANPITTVDMVDIPLGTVHRRSAESVIDIQREYATKLEESRERARQLRADLAVEEYRGQELSKILREIIPDPKTPSVQKFRHGRKGSLERRRMSKRLTEEAMTYFDECVSLSTFDSSDFSSQEDPPHTLPSVTNLVGIGSYFPQEPDDQTECLNRQEISGPITYGSHTIAARDRSSPSCANSTGIRRKSEFSFASKPDETFKSKTTLRSTSAISIQKKPAWIPSSEEDQIIVIITM